MKGLTTCPYCGVGCGVEVNVQGSSMDKVRGDKQHPANFGRLCVKGSSLHETLSHEGRLTVPSVDGQTVDWPEALDEVAKRFKSTIEEHGSDSVAFYLSGQLLTEDYYVANKLIKGYMGTANVDTNSRLCMASSVVGHKRAFGSDTVPCCYEDLDLADMLVLVGSNAAWNHPILFQQMQAAKKRNPNLKVVVIDPRKTATCDLADLHLAFKPGSDARLFCSLLAYIAKQGALNTDYIEASTQGFETALEKANEVGCDFDEVAAACDLDAGDLAQFFNDYVATEKVITIYSQGVNQSASGSNNVNAIINCHLATGRIGKPGMGPFSFTGQPNAMGGREVGGLANQLAAHMDFKTPGAIDRVQRFWNAPNMAQQDGLKAVDLFNAMDEGKIKAVWIMATNPVVSLPDADLVKRALEKCETVVVSECVANTDTTQVADILLPATGWSEKDGTVTNSERRISRQRGLIPSLGMARHDWWIMSEVAQRMGYEGFDYSHPYEIFAEHAQLSGFENNGSRDFDISYFSDITREAFDKLKPIQWPVTADAPEGTARMFTDGKFFTPSKKANFVPVSPSAPVQQPNKLAPLIMNTGRIRDQWHTMTRTGNAPRLFQHRQEPFVELHPRDAVSRNIAEGDLVKVFNQQGRYVARARIEEGQRKGEVFVPMHWNDMFASNGRMSTLVEKVTDPFSGQPESKHAICDVAALAPAWEAWFITRSDAKLLEKADYWAKIPKSNSCLYHIAGVDGVEAWPAWCADHLGAPEIEMQDGSGKRYRAAGFDGDRLDWVLLVLPYKEYPSADWLDSLFAKEEPLSELDRQMLLTATDVDVEDPGTIICSCFQVGSYAIEDAIAAGCNSAEALGKKLKCGTNCGSCLPELSAMVDAVHAKAS